jgi:oligoendopeptidase F
MLKYGQGGKKATEEPWLCYTGGNTDFQEIAMKYPRTWDLSSVYSSTDDTQFTEDMTRYKNQIADLKEQSAGLPVFTGGGTDNSASAWEKFYRAYISVQGLGSQLQVYVNCLASADAENKTYAILLGRLSALSANMQEVQIRLRSTLRDSDEAAFETAVAGNDFLASIDFHLRELRRSSAHMMDDPRETLAARLSVDGISAWGRFYTRISSSLKVELMEKGELVKRSVSQLKTDHPDRSYRENTFHASNRAWDAIADDCADALNHIAGTRLTLYREQGYEHFLDKPLEDNRLQRRSLDAMWDAISARKAMLKPWFDFKAKSIGIEKLSWFDQTAPLPGGGSISFDDAMDQVISQFSAFAPEMGQFAEDAVKRGFIESEDRGGKRPGAFCTRFIARKEPRVFMTFKDSYGSMRTLAHELGHAYHGYLLKDQPEPHQVYVMSTAETASTFAEAIINDYLIEHAEDQAMKLAMLDNSIRMSMVMLMNIHARFLFESELYARRSSGELSSEDLKNIMLEAQKEAYLDLLDEYDPLFWASKLHFYISGLSFYNFPYTFGHLFSGALYALAREQGPSFSQQYRNVLIDTGRKSTEDVIADNLEMDIGDAEFWNKSLDLIEKQISDFVRTAK